ncbi:two-component-system connector protein YcgZ [Pantoea sp. BL1]|uniref:regulatory protein YcgZ n=1 Tax=Erwiniaceae TaxID=1903409 RepID=UPI0005F79089|nr:MULTISPECIES: regulatory protein YcgZ [Erwiniaceae]KJV30209.1 two-component-system connector protein YcgZ [Pantoea sp. SM3]KJV48910.1 two-component-system connector protein YcgZ [Pantoea sp. BL1]MBK0092550.1 two-component-system connector protein YcgZ [Erwinia sp. S59]HAU5563422.1 two-component-system connector protein YcgZ [Serratia fonticola]
MRQDKNLSSTLDAITRYFNEASLPSQQETLGKIVVEILRSGRSLSRKTLCTKLICRLEQANSPEEELHLQQLIGLMFTSER